jgi:hypothetical protein
VATVQDIVNAARLWLRDYSQFYTSTVTGDGINYAYHLPHPLVKVDSTLQVIRQTSTPQVLVLNTDFTVDARNGWLILTSPLPVGAVLVVNFFAFDWFLDEDLQMFANFMIGEFGQNISGYSIANVEPAEAEALGLGTTVMALWSLLNELARDIDVSSFVDGTNIPATQRFRQVQALLMSFEGMYKDKAAMLNVGLDRIEAFALRRVSLTTNRLVPVYKPREIDDLSTPRRVYPPVDSMGNAASATPNYPQGATAGSDPFWF